MDDLARFLRPAGGGIHTVMFVTDLLLDPRRARDGSVRQVGRMRVARRFA